VHHSDRGSQYASNDYTDLLKANGIDISMSRKGNPERVNDFETGDVRV
jgi:transposase InsO family protein